MTLELGGKSLSAIFEDYNFDNAVWLPAFVITQNSGQACFAASRLYGQESIADEFIDPFTNAMSEKVIELGDRANPDTQLGLLADKGQLNRVSSFFEKHAGKIRVLIAGKQNGEKGCYWEPTVLLDP